MDGFRTESIPPAATLLDLVWRWTRRTPEALAVGGARALTFGELARKVDAVAALLRQWRTGRGDVVGVVATRSPLTPVLALGCMAAGAVYLPLDPLYPFELLRHMAMAAGAHTMVLPGSHDGAPVPCPPGSQILHIDVSRLGKLRSDCVPPTVPGGPAYAMFTSGTTGRPKGVLLGHRGLADYALALSDRVGLGAGDRCLGIAPAGFSSSVRQLLVPLACGASVIVPSEDQIRTPWEMTDLLSSHQVTQLDVTPSYWSALLRSLPSDEIRQALASVRRILFASERCDAALAHRTQELAPHARVWNMYGATETTGIVCAYEVTGDEPMDEPVPIGRALDHVSVTVAPDTDCNGQVGPIVVTGRAVALGALGEDAPPVDSPHGRTLVTGDLAEVRDGMLVWRGRADRMVKVRGMKVAPEAVEEQLVRFDGIHRAAVVGCDERGPECLVELEAGHALDLEALMRWLRSRLPAHMVPASVCVAAPWPMLPNGKTDLRGLAAHRRRAATSTAIS